MENTDAKVFLMIEDLSRVACLELLGTPRRVTAHSHASLRGELRRRYEAGDVPAEEIIAAWNDDTWNGKE